MNKIFDKEKALSYVDNDNELLKILIQAFLDTEFSVETLNKFIASRRAVDATSYVHRVKGAGRQLAMEKLALSGQILEDVLRGKSQAELKPLIQNFYADYEQAVQAVKPELDSL